MGKLQTVTRRALSPRKPNGAILYRGPSMLDGAPIVAIVTGLASGSSNSKTGAMLQTWILREDMSPTSAAASGADVSICGDCPHRGTVADGKNVGRSCYVTLFQGPLSVWKSYHRGIYAPAESLSAIGAGRPVRIGSYGDPAAVPFAVWEALASQCAFSTGYTHQWRIAPALKSLCMASCDTAADAMRAQLLGWRTFRVRSADDPTLRRESVCPASIEAGKKLTCATCQSCNGTASKRHGSIVIVAHGSGARSFGKAA